MLETITDSITVGGRELIDKVYELADDTTVKRIVVKDDSGDVTFAIPLGLGIFGVFLNPLLAGISAVILKANNYTINVIRKEDI